MNKKTQDLAWACLPKETRQGMRNIIASESDNDEYDEGYDNALFDFFGEYNLKSDTEPEELLYAPKWRVQQYFEGIDVCIDISDLEQLKALRTALKYLFGDKCLPDKQPIFSKTQQNENNDNVIVGSEKLSEVKPNLSENLSETKDNMEEKELNLCELLRDYKGEKIYVLSHGYMTVMGGLIGTVELEGAGEYGETLNLVLNYDGTHIKGTEVIAFPSRALYEKYPLDPYSAWMEWKEARKPVYGLFGSMLIFEDGAKVDEIDFPDINFSSLEEAQQAAEGVREYLQKFHDQSAK